MDTMKVTVYPVFDTKALAASLRSAADALDPEYEIDGDMMPWSDVLGHVQRLHQHITEAESAMKELAVTKEAQPAPIAVGDYVRLTGERWGEHMGKVVRVVRAEGETEYAAVEIDGAEWYVTPNWTAERLTVTADLDDPWNLPMPEVGEYVWVEYLDGALRTGEVMSVEGVRVLFEDGQAFISRAPDYWRGDAWVAAWGPYDPADLTPDEPTTFGYVGYVTDADGDVWDVVLDGDTYKPFSLVNRTTGKFESRYWSDVLALGTFAAVER